VHGSARSSRNLGPNPSIENRGVCAGLRPSVAIPIGLALSRVTRDALDGRGPFAAPHKEPADLSPPPSAFLGLPAGWFGDCPAAANKECI
jgi:hypothetical protein